MLIHMRSGRRRPGRKHSCVWLDLLILTRLDTIRSALRDKSTHKTASSRRRRGMSGAQRMTSVAPLYMNNNSRRSKHSSLQ